MISEGQSNKKRFQRNLETASRMGVSTQKLQAASSWMKDFFKNPVSANNSANDIIARTPKSSRKTKIELGSLYMFSYEAITETLQYFDKFPLVIPVNEDSDHFWGINLHYAPPLIRAKIFDAIRDIVEDPHLLPVSKRQKIASFTATLMKQNFIKPLIKCYLKSQVRSRFIHVQFENWEHVLYLPLARFNNVTEKQVFKDYKRTV